MFTQMPLVCGSTNLCYITTNNLKSNTNKPDIINKNLMYIERGIYYSIINTLSMYDNNINKDKLTQDISTNENLLNENGYVFYK